MRSHRSSAFAPLTVGAVKVQHPTSQGAGIGSFGGSSATQCLAFQRRNNVDIVESPAHPAPSPKPPPSVIKFATVIGSLEGAADRLGQAQFAVAVVGALCVEKVVGTRFDFLRSNPLIRCRTDWRSSAVNPIDLARWLRSCRAYQHSVLRVPRNLSQRNRRLGIDLSVCHRHS